MTSNWECSKMCPPLMCFLMYTSPPERRGTFFLWEGEMTPHWSFPVLFGLFMQWDVKAPCKVIQTELGSSWVGKSPWQVYKETLGMENGILDVVRASSWTSFSDSCERLPAFHKSPKWSWTSKAAWVLEAGRKVNGTLSRLLLWVLCVHPIGDSWDVVCAN